MGLEPPVITYCGKKCSRLSALCLFGHHATCHNEPVDSPHKPCDCPCHDAVSCSLCAHASNVTPHELVQHTKEFHISANFLGVANADGTAEIMTCIVQGRGPDIFERREVDRHIRVSLRYRQLVLGLFEVTTLPNAETSAGIARQTAPAEYALCNKGGCTWRSDPQSDANIARQCLDHLISAHGWDDAGTIVRIEEAVDAAMRDEAEDDT